MLHSLTSQRRALQTKIKDFSVRQPSALRIEVNGEPVVFPIDQLTGRVATLPKVGVWGWAKGLAWIDLKLFLERREYRVVEVMPVLG